MSKPTIATSDDIDALKRDMRRSAKALRDEVFARAGAAAGEQLAQHGLGFASVKPPAVVSGFFPFRAEIDARPLMSRLLAEGYELALPVMEGKGKPLIFRRWKPGDEMAEAKWGIQEPLPDAPVVEPDILLGPLLAFDRAGYRLGYGGGFYDRTLQKLRASKPVVSIGLAFGEQQVDAVPHLDYDERVDWVLTPDGPIRCSEDSF